MQSVMQPTFANWFAVRLASEPFGISTVRRLNCALGDEKPFYRDGYAIVNATTAPGALDFVIADALTAGDWDHDQQCVRIQPAPALPVPVSNGSNGKVQP